MFKKEQATKFKKGLEESLWSKWARIANKILKEKIAEGVAVLEAEIIAVRAANATFGEQTAPELSFSEMQEHEELRLAEVTDANADEFQLVIPIGTTFDDWYGEITLTKTFMEAMVDNQTALKNTRPFLNEQHDRGKSLGWAEDIRATDEGLEVKWGFTKLGRSYIEDDIYKYYSGEITAMRDRDTGEQIYPVFGGAALTNAPVMKGMPEAHLSNNKTETAERLDDEGEENMDFSKLKAEAESLSNSEKQELVIALGFNSRDDEVTDLSEKVTAMTEVNSTLKQQVVDMSAKLKERNDADVEEFLLTAIADGKIKPADKDVWTERLNKDFGDYSKIINDLPTIVNLDDAQGTGQDEDTDGKDFKTVKNEMLGKKETVKEGDK